MKNKISTKEYNEPLNINHPVVKSILSHKYNNPEIRKSIKIFKRTKSKRIRNKHFDKMLYLAVKEKKAIQVNNIVIIDIETYNSFKNI